MTNLRRMAGPLLLAALAFVPAPVHAQAPVAAGPVQLVALRSWSAPTETRVVFEFSRHVAPVAPDSGMSRSVVIALPADALVRADGVPAVLGVRDGLVDSVVVTAAATGSRFQLWFRDSTRFRVFPLGAETGKPFRLVVDVSRPGARAAEEKRISHIATIKKQQRLRIVSVDAGHGGEDTGARGPNGVIEKTVTLAVAKALVDELNKIPGIRGVLTRDGDYFIPLRERYHIAERMKADLFVSIHANSSKRRGQGKGTEVFFLSLKGASDQATHDLAEAENAADLVGGVPEKSEDALVDILYDVKRTAALQQSQLLAETLLEHLAADRRLESRGITQAGFAVLKSVEFPSVLVETAFINNPVEARLLRSPEFQKQMGKQLAAGVKVYFERSGIELGETVGTNTR